MCSINQIHDDEKRRLNSLHQDFIPPGALHEYYTMLAGLRFRLFEGILTNFLDYKGRALSDGLQGKINAFKSLGKDGTQGKGIAKTLGNLPALRNCILHGDFNCKVSQPLWDELNGFLLKIEYYCQSSIEGIEEELTGSQEQLDRLQQLIKQALDNL